jgi:hypothetical protein
MFAIGLSLMDITNVIYSLSVALTLFKSKAALFSGSTAQVWVIQNFTYSCLILCFISYCPSRCGYVLPLPTQTSFGAELMRCITWCSSVSDTTPATYFLPHPHECKVCPLNTGLKTAWKQENISILILLSISCLTNTIPGTDECSINLCWLNK